MKEVILHARPDRYRDALRADPIGTVLQTLELQAARERPDFEVLFGGGQIARLEQVTDLNGAIADWLQGSDLPQRWDLAACFLMGYWAPPMRADQALVALLLQQLDQMDSEEPGWNELVRALGAASTLMADGAAAGRVRDALRTAVARANPFSIQTGTAAALDAALGAEALQRGGTCPRAVLILLGGTAAHPARTLDDTVAQDRHGALAHDHLSTGGFPDARRRGVVGPLGEFAAGATEGS